MKRSAEIEFNRTYKRIEICIGDATVVFYSAECKKDISGDIYVSADSVLFRELINNVYKERGHTHPGRRVEYMRKALQGISESDFRSMVVSAKEMKRIVVRELRRLK
jgi:hypothetical protein